ncbi:MAG: hypothetical protein FWB86_04675 [Treponema sp.]|nr:hypothetical protein [Treponema sp.]MCL2250740.1 hypothetical protein [Treponema sp.]
MKIKNILIITVFSIIVAACFSSWEGGSEGTITIRLSGSSGRFVFDLPWPPTADSDQNQILEYEVSLTGNNGKITLPKEKGAESITATVPVGFYTIIIDAYLIIEDKFATTPDTRLTRRYYAVGSSSIEVIAGHNTYRITMYQVCQVCGKDKDRCGCRETGDVCPKCGKNIPCECGETDYITFQVNNQAEWDVAISSIKSAKEDDGVKNYLINIHDNIVIAPSDGSTFGDNGNISVVIDGNGKSLKLNDKGPILRIVKNQSIMLTNVNLVGRDDNNTAVIIIEKDSSVIMSGSTSVLGNYSFGNGGGVLINGGTLNMMDDSSIYNNLAANGGGVYVMGEYGQLNMDNNASIYNNVSEGSSGGNGGGVLINGGTLKMMDDSSIYNNRAANGGGVYVMGEYGQLNMENNASIYYNNASEGNGGGVLIGNKGTFQMTGDSKIYMNRAYDAGGGVYVGDIDTTESGTFIMDKNASINNNEAYVGGGVYVGYGEFRMVNGTISGNKAASNDFVPVGQGGGVYIRGKFSMEDGIISGNFAVNYGGGVFIAGEFIKTGGIIYGNENEVEENLRNTAEIGAAYGIDHISFQNNTLGKDDNYPPLP